MNRADLANIRCPDKLKFNRKILKAYSDSLKVRPPYVFTTPKFSLPTIQTKKENLSGVPVKVLPIEDIVLNVTNVTFPKKDLTAIEADLNILNNLTSMHSEHLEFINDNVQNKPLLIIHGATGILVVIVIMVVVVGIIVIRRKPNLLQQMLPFFLLNNNMSSHSQRTQHEDRRQQSSELGEMVSELGEMVSELGEMVSELGEMVSELGEMVSELGEMVSELGEMVSELGEMVSELGES